MKRGAPLRRTPFKAKAAVQAKRERAPLVLVPRAGASRAVMALAKPHPAKAALKTPDRKNQAIRDSARDEECTVRITGVCNHDPKTTVWSHAPLGAAGKAGALKALDLCGCYSCAACHDVVDGRAPRPAGVSREQVLIDWFFGHMRSLVRLKQKGLV